MISKLQPYEIIFPQSQEEKIKVLFKNAFGKRQPAFSPCQDWYFNQEMARKSLSEHFKMHNLRGFGIDGMPVAISTSAALLEYLKQMNKHSMLHINKISLYNDSDYVFISAAAHQGLQLDDLIKTLDQTLTSLGKRNLKQWVYHPLKEKNPSSTANRR